MTRRARSASCRPATRRSIVEFDERIDPAVNARAIALAEAIQAARARRRSRRRADVSVRRGLLRSAAHRRATRLLACVRARGRRGPRRRRRRERAGPHSGVLRRRARPGSCRLSRRSRRHERGRGRSRCTPRATYRVFMLGFMPGLRVPGDRRRRGSPRRAARRRACACRRDRSASPACRRASIRRRRPAAGSSIGRTPLKPFDLERAEPFLFKPATPCSSTRSNRREYDRLAECR